MHPAMEKNLASLQARLDQCQSWPCTYTFKFIVPATSAGDMAALFSGFDFSARQSSGGKYLSYTVDMNVDCSERVISIYRAALGVAGCIAL